MAAKRTPKESGRFIAVGDKKPDRTAWIREQCQDSFGAIVPRGIAIVYVTETQTQEDWCRSQSLPWDGRHGPDAPMRVVCIWDVLPVDAIALVSWKDHFLASSDTDNTILVCPSTLDTLKAFQDWFQQQFERWQSPPAANEEVRFTLGERVKIPPETDQTRVSAAFVSMTFGVMEELLERLEFWRRHYLEQVIRITPALREKIHKHLTPILKRSDSDDENEWKRRDELEKKLRKVMEDAGLLIIHSTALPVVLLTGETGTGKTLIARYLARSANGLSLPFTRISMPEFESSEHAFEYEVFGFRGGTYSDAPPSGDAGILLNHIGGVVFLDEIGDASKQTQRKMLAYLDDYEVRPRGVHHSIFCPTMIVAATNHDLKADVASGDFRRDLFERFDTRVPVPSLNERKPDFEFILDTVLQNPGINPGHRITEISRPAYDFLFAMDYKDGNFRRIENLLRFGIREAIRASRTRLLKADLEKWQSFQKGS
jgi:hypothetical protein